MRHLTWIIVVAVNWFGTSSVVGQTNLVTNQTASKAYFIPPRPADVIWGAATNGIRFGLKERGVMIWDGWFESLVGKTGQARNVVRPVANQRFALTLLDETGREVGRTAAGRAIGQPLVLDRELVIEQDPTRAPVGWRGGVGYRTVVLFTGEPTGIEHIDLRNYFRIKKAGTYTLSVEQRLFLLQTNQQYTGLLLPKVTVECEISHSELQRR